MVIVSSKVNHSASVCVTIAFTHHSLHSAMFLDHHIIIQVYVSLGGHIMSFHNLAAYDI